jgi:hypothetical protein
MVETPPAEHPARRAWIDKLHQEMKLNPQKLEQNESKVE